MTRLQRVLSALLAVQVVLAALVFWPRTSDTAGGGPLLAELAVEDIQALTVEDGDRNRTRLVRQGDGWILDESGEYPADGEKIEPILAKLATIQTNRLVARTSDSHKRLQVGDSDFAGRIQLEMNDGSTQTLLIGSAPNPSGTHVRRIGQNETFLTGELAAWEVAPTITNWIDTLYVSLDRTELVSLKLENGNGVFEFEKNSEGEWTLKDLADEEAFAVGPLNTLLSRITNMRMTQPLGTVEKPEYGLDDPQAIVTVIVEDSEDQSTKMHTLLVGAHDPGDDNFIVKWSDSDYYVKVAIFNTENMVNQVRADFIEPPATPTPEA